MKDTTFTVELSFETLQTTRCFFLRANISLGFAATLQKYEEWIEIIHADSTLTITLNLYQNLLHVEVAK